MKKTIRKITILLLVAFLLIPVFNTGLECYLKLKGAYALTDNDYDKTNILEDLSGLNLDDYKPDKTKDIQLLTFVEYAYPYYKDMKEHYALYVYIYNPKQLYIDVNSRAHNIVMSSEFLEDFNTTSYDSFELNFLNKSEAPYRDLFYKFKIVDRNINNTYFYDRADKNNREYQISDIKIKEYSKPLTNIKIGQKFLFNGYSKGYGQDPTKMTLQTKKENYDVIELEVEYDFYRTGVNYLGKGHRSTVNTVYFSIDNALLEKYDYLEGIKAEWYEYKLNDAIITSDINLYNALKNVLGYRIIDSQIPDFNYVLFHQDAAKPDKMWFYNNPLGSTLADKNVFYNAFYLEDIDDYVKKDDIFNHINSYNKTYDKGFLDLPSRQISADLFLDEVDEGRKKGYNSTVISAGDKFNLLSYSSTQNNFWQTFIDYGFNRPPSLDENHFNKKPIEEVKLEDVNKSTAKFDLLINDTEKLKNYITEANLNKKRTHLFRFAITDYYSESVGYYKNNSATGFPIRNKASLARETAFMDFTIIYLRFKKGENYTIIPVSMEPVDLIADLEKDEDGVLEKWWEKLIAELKRIFGDITKMLQTIFLSIIIIVIIFLIVKLVGFVSDQFSKIKVNKIYKNQKKDKK